jgi:hypothetical protein
MTSSKPGTFCIDVDHALGADSQGTKPTFRSVVMNCPLEFGDDADGAAAMFFVSGTDNNLWPYTSTLTNTFVNGANETAVPAVDFSSIASPELTAADKSFLTQVPYIGAVKDASDTWWQGWSCGIGGGPAC